MSPPKGEEASAVLDECPCHRGNRDAHGNELSGRLVHDHRQVVQRQERQIHPDVVIDLLVGQWRIAEYIIIGFVDELEDSVAIVVNELLAVSVLDVLQVVALGHDAGDAHHLLGNLGRDGDEHLNPVGILGKAQAFHVLGIVGVVVDASAGAHTVKALDEHALGIHVGET